MQSYLCGIGMKEEVDYDFHVPLVMGAIHTGWSPTTQTHNNYLKQIMEEEITLILEEFQQTKNRTEKENDDVETVYCNYCQENPCVWVSNKDNMARFDDSANSLFTGDAIPTPNLRRKGLYRQMALIIAGGPTRKGVRMELHICFVNGIREMFPAVDKDYMGHMEN